jgi:hypothetical protein
MLEPFAADAVTEARETELVPMLANQPAAFYLALMAAPASATRRLSVPQLIAVTPTGTGSRGSPPDKARPAPIAGR